MHKSRLQQVYHQESDRLHKHDEGTCNDYNPEVPSHSLDYTGLTKSLQHQWTHLQRVIPDIATLFAPVEAVIADIFLLAKYSEQVNATVQTLAALPIKCAGLAITNPVQTSHVNCLLAFVADNSGQGRVL